MNTIIRETIEILNQGKTILYPTDTVWGIGCDATNNKAVEKVYDIKLRQESKSMIILVCDVEMLGRYVDKIPETAFDLIDSIKTPLTIIYPNGKGVAKNLIAKDKTLAVRITKDEFCRELIQQYGKPVVSTSANLSGEPTPLVYSRISKHVIESVDYIVDLNRKQIKDTKHSTIIKILNNGEFSVIRH